MTITVKRSHDEQGMLLGKPPFAPKPPQLGSRPTGEPVGSLTSHVPVEQLPGEPVGSSATTSGKSSRAPIPLAPRGTDTVLRLRPEGLHRT